jgi:hypothetical protein
MIFFQQKETETKFVDNFQDPEIKLALRGEWLTLALSHFETTLTTSHFRSEFDCPAAHGVVHFEFGKLKMIRAKLTLIEEPDHIKREQVGHAHFTRMDDILDNERNYVLLEVFVDDPRGKISNMLHLAFESAALSQNRYIHVRLRRARLDIDPMLVELIDKGWGADHPLTELKITRNINLPLAPVSS